MKLLKDRKYVEVVSHWKYDAFIGELETFINRDDISIVDLKYASFIDEDNDHWNKCLIFYKEKPSGNSDGD